MTPFNNKPESSRDLIILIKSSISLFDIITVIDEGLLLLLLLLLLLSLLSLSCPDPNIFLCIPASAADAAAVNPRGI